MTPLAAQLFNERHNLLCRGTVPLTQEKIIAFVRDAMNRAKFFELSEVMQLVYQISQKMYGFYDEHDRMDTRLAFLPAEMTWIEWDNPGFRDRDEDAQFLIDTINTPKKAHRKWNYTYRAAHVLIGRGDSTGIADRMQVGYESPEQPGKQRIWRFTQLSPLPLVNSGLKPKRSNEMRNVNGDIKTFERALPDFGQFVNYAQLALINSPRFIGRRQHMPHEKIEREKLKTMKLIGKFPLRAWTEILLTVAPPTIGGSEIHEAHLTGEKCLHFCRTHLRLRHGQLEYVEGHWRGNPALGMKRSRYRLDVES